MLTLAFCASLGALLLSVVALWMASNVVRREGDYEATRSKATRALEELQDAAVEAMAELGAERAKIAHLKNRATAISIATPRVSGGPFAGIPINRAIDGARFAASEARCLKCRARRVDGHQPGCPNGPESL